jgi:hypothetical protein
MTMYGGRDAATGAAVRPPDLAVVRQVDHDLVSVMLRIVTLTSPSSPVCGCAGRPQPRSSRMAMACMRRIGLAHDGGKRAHGLA